MIETIIIYCIILYVLSFIFKPRVELLACGLIGFSGKTNYSLDKIKMLMLWNSVERGKDATGMFTPKSGILKDNDPAHKFFFGKDIQNLKEDNTLIAHVRAKTVGANLAKNAHPFQYGETILAHNGTLAEVYQLGQKYDMKAMDWDVDSQVIANGINKAFERGEEKINFDILGEYKGFAALLFYNHNTGYLYAFHDKDRPLFYGWNTEGNMYISSIEDSLKAAGLFEVKSFDVNCIYKIHDGNIVDIEKYALYEEVHKEEIEAEKKKQELLILSKKAKKAERREAKFSFPKLEEGQRGLKKEDVDLASLIGFYIKSTSTSIYGYQIGAFGESATTKEGNWYLCTGYYPSSKTLIEIEDEQGIERVAYLYNFNLTNFIPRNNDYIIFVIGISSKKGHVDLWDEGDTAQIIDIDYNTMKAGIYNERLKKAFRVPTAFFRLAEGIEVIDNLPDNEIQEAIIISEEENEDNDESMQNLLRDMRDPKDDYIDSGALEGLVDNIKDAIDKLEEKYSLGGDITGEINEINAILNCSSDPQYLSNCKKIV